uniref:Lipoprotein n=1 Tax=Panagrellus redivivus TaxID=6233 RepID=A0A7E4V8Q6_PANRE
MKTFFVASFLAVLSISFACQATDMTTAFDIPRYPAKLQVTPKNPADITTIIDALIGTNKYPEVADVFKYIKDGLPTVDFTTATAIGSLTKRQCKALGEAFSDKTVVNSYEVHCEGCCIYK